MLSNRRDNEARVVQGLTRSAVASSLNIGKLTDKCSRGKQTTNPTHNREAINKIGGLWN